MHIKRIDCCNEADIFQVTVGGSSPPAYSPPSTSGVVNGDTIVFVFETANHTVTQSSFDNPCQKFDEGFKSGFVPSNGTLVPYMVAQYACSDPNDMCSPMCKSEVFS